MQTIAYYRIAKEDMDSTGYEAGLFGMEGRGLYAGANVGGVYAQVAQNGGWSYGWSMMVANGGYNSEKGFAYNYIGRDIVNSAFNEDCADVPAIGENLVPESNFLVSIWHVFTEDGAFGTNYVGSTPEDKIGKMPITGALDLAAFLHDIAYIDAGASGPTSAFFNTSRKVLATDFRLTLRSFAAAFRDNTGGKSHTGGALGTGIVFGTMAIYKTLLHYSNTKRSPLDNLWY
ncbi:MAG TPA: hypothetical protein VLZ83_13005 [Edaphocola sp.]|nr:hypothetical protein [Edaphocola sp.]